MKNVVEISVLNDVRWWVELLGRYDKLDHLRSIHLCNDEEWRDMWADVEFRKGLFLLRKEFMNSFGVCSYYPQWFRDDDSLFYSSDIVELRENKVDLKNGYPLDHVEIRKMFIRWVIDKLNKEVGK